MILSSFLGDGQLSLVSWQTNKFYNWGIKKLKKNIFYFLTPLSRREFKQKT